MRFSKKKKPDFFSIEEGAFKYGQIGNHSYRLRWVEESFLDREKGEERISTNFDTRQVYYLAGLAICAVLIIIFRAGWLQLFKNDYYYSLAEGNRIRIQRIEPKRGVIYDRNMKSLVSNAPNFMLYLVPADLYSSKGQIGPIFNGITAILKDISTKDLHERLEPIKPGSLESFQPLFIADNIDYDQAMLLYLHSANWPGVVLSNKTKREYDLTASSTSHILGYTGKINQKELEKYGNDYLPIDYIGKTGVEQFWENEMKGISGKKQIEVDALGKEKKIIGKNDPVDGHNIVLSLDSGLQKEAEAVLRRNLSPLNVKRGAIVIMDPNNGEILVMVSLPTYDNNALARGINSDEYKKLLEDKDLPMFNRAISGEYPPGSTIKLVMSAAGLDEGVINENTFFLSTGGLRINQWFFPDWKTGGHGVANVKRAIAESINTFFYYIGGGYQDFKGLGVDRIAKYFEEFGLGAQTGIDIPGEREGFIPSKEWKTKVKGENWYIGDTYHISIGQGDLLTTPLQVAVYTSIFANGGKYYRPHFIRQILSSNDKILNTIKEDPVRENFVKPENIRIVREGMRQTVTSGSGRRLNSLGVEVAGKTGTAQNTTSKTKTHSWFTAFAPYENPELVITILAEEAGGGDKVSVPIAEEILKWYFARSGKIKSATAASSSPETVN